jgi:hypothetical protein
MDPSEAVDVMQRESISHICRESAIIIAVTLTELSGLLLWSSGTNSFTHISEHRTSRFYHMLQLHGWLGTASNGQARWGLD